MIMALDLKTAAKQGAIASVALSLAALVSKLADFLMNEVARDIEFLINLVDTTCGK